MTQTNTFWRLDSPSDHLLAAAQSCTQSGRTVEAFLPEGYEPRYPYPLLVFFPGAEQKEDKTLELAAKLSRRNYVALTIQTPVAAEPVESFEQAMEAATRETLAEFVMRSVNQVRRACHIHSERVYLIGVREGAAAAFETAFALSDRIAGVASLNGCLPRNQGRPLFTTAQVRGLRILQAHGAANHQIPIAEAVRDHQAFYSAGAEVGFHRYNSNHQIHDHMLRDLNRWIIGHVTKEQDQLSTSVRKRKKK